MPVLSYVPLLSFNLSIVPQSNDSPLFVLVSKFHHFGECFELSSLFSTKIFVNLSSLHSPFPSSEKFNTPSSYSAFCSSFVLRSSFRKLCKHVIPVNDSHLFLFLFHPLPPLFLGLLCLLRAALQFLRSLDLPDLLASFLRGLSVAIWIIRIIIIISLQGIIIIITWNTLYPVT